MVKCSFLNPHSGFPDVNIAKENFLRMCLRIRTQNGGGKIQLFALSESVSSVQAALGYLHSSHSFSLGGLFLTSGSP